MNKKGNKKRITDSKRWIFLVAFLIVITLFNFNKTSSRYMAEIASNTDAIAVPILTFTNNQASYNIENMLPGDTREITFSVSNTDNDKQNEVILKYSLKLETENTLPLQYKLYEIINGSQSEVTLTDSRTPEETVGFDSTYLRKYKLEIIWDANNNSYEYAGKNTICNIKLEGEQVIE